MFIIKSKFSYTTISPFVRKEFLNTLKKLNYCTIHSRKLEVPLEKKNEITQEEKVGNNRITRLGFNDTSLSKIMLQVKSKKMRTKSNLIFFEGKRILKEALDSGVIPIMVFFTRMDDIKDFKFSDDTKLFKMPYNEMKIYSSLTTPPGILAICRQPEIVQNNRPNIPVTIICDNIREPGNLGAVFRNALGAGVKDVILSEGCVDLWDPKVIRGGVGTQFRLPVYQDIDWSDMKNYLKEDTLLLIANNKHCADENDSAIPYWEVDYCNYPSITLIIGGETEGISEKALNLMEFFSAKMINIPLSNNVESLNSVSALSIILFEIKRQVMFVK